MSDLDLLARLIEDPDALDAADWQRAQALVAADPARLRRMLRSDELVSRALDPARADLHAAVRHRIEHPVPSGRFAAAVLRRRPAPRRRPAFALVGIAAAALAALVALIVGVATWDPGARTRERLEASAARDAVAELRLGAAEAQRAGTALALAAGAPLSAGDELVAGTAGATIAFDDGSTLALVAGARLRLAHGGGGDGPRAELAAGALEAEVTPQPAGHPLVLATPEALVTVIGTRFALACGDGRTRLAVTHGRVQLAQRGAAARVIEVAAGQSAVAAPGAELRADPPDERVLFATDFETQAPGRSSIGTVGEEPGAGRSLAAVPSEDGQPVARARVADLDRALFTYEPGAVLTFRYRIDERAGALSVYVWNRTRQTSVGGFELYPPGLAVGRWASASVDLASLRSAGEALHAGDEVSEITIQTGLGPAALRIDDVRVVARPPP